MIIKHSVCVCVLRIAATKKGEQRSLEFKGQDDRSLQRLSLGEAADRRTPGGPVLCAPLILTLTTLC